MSNTPTTSLNIVKTKLPDTDILDIMMSAQDLATIQTIDWYTVQNSATSIQSILINQHYSAYSATGSTRHIVYSSTQIYGFTVAFNYNVSIYHYQILHPIRN